MVLRYSGKGAKSKLSVADKFVGFVKTTTSRTMEGGGRTALFYSSATIIRTTFKSGHSKAVIPVAYLLVTYLITFADQNGRSRRPEGSSCLDARDLVQEVAAAWRPSWSPHYDGDVM